MHTVFKNEKVLKNCKIFRMLFAQSATRHLSFHTPGHKTAGWDITELSYSDNLSCPRGCIAEAEKDIAEILGAYKSFLLTDGSTSGVLSMLYAAKSLGARTVAFCENAHKSVWNGCKLLGLTPLVYPQKTREKIPFPYTMSELKQKFGALIEQADALLFTSPDYYGNIADWGEIRKYCDETGKLLLADGAHGGHLHFDKNTYAGAYADMWVDGVHKSLPAFTQAAVLSARNTRFAEALFSAVDIFRTTSPSYPVMASAEYAVRYPRNEALEAEVRAYLQTNDRLYSGGDWTKLCAKFGKSAFEVQKLLEAKGIYPEFCDGNVVMFYLSPATEENEFAKLTEVLTELFARFPLHGVAETEKKPLFNTPVLGNVEWIDVENSEGRTCAGICGLFPPCTPLLRVGERITKEQIRLLQNADNVFGIKEGKILVLKEKEEE